MDAADATVSLVARAPDDVLFRNVGRSVTAGEFASAASSLAAVLPDGRHVVNLCTDRCSFAIVLAAACLRGQVSLLTSDRSAGQIAALGTRYEHTYSVSNDPTVASLIRHALVDCRVPAVRGDAPDLRTDQLVAEVFTSGTTGEAIAHGKRWGALVERTLAAGAQFGWDAARPASLIATVPPQHMYGLETSVLMPLHAHCASWCGPAFYPHDIARALEACPPPRVLVTTPLQLQALLRAGTALPPLAAVISATAPLDRGVAAAAERRWDTQVLEIYGATEFGSIASRRTTQGDVWTAYPGLRLAPDPGSPDTLLVSAPHAPAHPLSDVVEELDDRHFRLMGRRADLLKLGGRRASLAGLNAILNRVEGVIDGVFLAPDDLDRRPSARMRAFAVSTGPTADDILAALRRELDPVFLPRRVVLVPCLPRNELGKLTRAALDAMQAAASEA